MDAFLHTEDDVEALVERGTIYRQYCRSCGGHNIDDVSMCIWGLLVLLRLNASPVSQAFISHSFSLHQLRFLYKDVLPTLGYNRASASLLDVGARLGAVLYGVRKMGAEFWTMFTRSVVVDPNSVVV